MSHARDVVYKSEILGVAVHSCALPEGEGCGPMGNHNTIGFLSNTGSEPTNTRKALKSAFNVGPQSAGRPAKRHFNGKTVVGPIIARSPDKRFWICA